MKKIILTVCIAVTIISCSVQKPRSGNTSYKALKNFNKDTLAYLKYNFDEHANSYKGKPISAVVNDLEVRVLNYVPCIENMNPPKPISNMELMLGVIKQQVVYFYIDLDQPLQFNDALAILDKSRKAYPDSIYKNSPIERNFYNKLHVKNIHVYNGEFKKK